MNLDNVNMELVNELSQKAVDYSVTLIPGIISAILVKGVLHFTLVSLNTAVIKDPTKLIATKKTKLEI